MATAELDHAKLETFMGKVMGDLAGMVTITMCAIGDRLGLFTSLAEHGALTSGELAQRAQVSERYAREWLSAMACAGYVEYDAASTRFTLPPEHARALAEEAGPFFVGGVGQELVGALKTLDLVTDAFRTGGGVPQSAYDDDLWNGMDRFTATWFENLLLDVWVPALPEIEQKLKTGARVADIGCGRGRALIKLAQAFPASHYVGYDAFLPSVERAREAAAAAGVGDRVHFEVLDAAQGIPDRYDVITTFDVVHDAVDPKALVTAIRTALEPDGSYLMLEINASDKLEENTGPLGAAFYGISILYCMTTSLAHGGAGLGTCGMHEAKVRELCREAGFGTVNRLPLENPFNVLYEIKP